MHERRGRKNRRDVLTSTCHTCDFRGGCLYVNSPRFSSADMLAKPLFFYTEVVYGPVSNRPIVYWMGGVSLIF
jgi:hypothetical protein